MPEPTEGPWVAAPVINGLQHPGEVRGPHGPICYVSLAVPIEQRKATISRLAAAPEMFDLAVAFVEWVEDMPDENYEQREIELMALAKAAIAKAKGE